MLRRRRRGKKAGEAFQRPPATGLSKYPPPLLPKLAPDQEVSFFLPKSNEKDILACTLTRWVRKDPQTAEEEEEEDSSAVFTRVKRGRFAVDSSKPVVIVCHGTHSWRNQMLLAFLASGMSEGLGCHALRFDFLGNGHSTGEWRYGNYDGEADDLQQVVRFVREEMKSRVLCVVGHSKACQSVVQLAIQEEQEKDDKDRIPFFVLLAGRFAVPNQLTLSDLLAADQMAQLEESDKTRMVSPMGAEFEATREDVEERIKLDTTICSQAKKGRFFVLHGSNDETVPTGDAYKFEETLTNCRMSIIEGADHNFSGLKHIRNMTSQITEFCSNP